jgi:hypothetical protein
VARHAGVRAATVTAGPDGDGGVRVSIRDEGRGFDPARAGLASSGVRSSIRARMRDAGGSAAVISAPGQGTTVVLLWRPPPAGPAEAVDPLGWGRRLAPSPLLIFLGFMVPQLVASLALLSLTWHELRWPAVGVAAFAGLLVLAAVTAPCVSRVRMGRWATVCCAIAVAALVAAGTLAVAPGTTDGYGYWVAGESGILIGVIFFVRGAWFGGAALLLDLAVLTAGLLANDMTGGAWVGILASPVLGGGLGAGFRLAFRSLARSTERQLAGYRERLRRQARAEALRRVDRTALDHARRVAGPILARVAGGEPAWPGLRTAAELGGATLRDELLAPGFLPGDLAGRVREARRAGARITVQSPRPRDAELAAAARDLLTAALAPGGAAEVTLHIHPPAGGQRALLIMRVCGLAVAGQAAIRDRARRHRARLSELGGGDVLVRLEAAARPAHSGDSTAGPGGSSAPS